MVSNIAMSYSVGMKKNYEVLSERIRTLRGTRTQSEMAEVLNITQAYLSEIERGKKAPSNSLLLDMAQKFDTTVSYLLGETNSIALPNKFPVFKNDDANRLSENGQPNYMVIPLLPFSEIIEACKTHLMNKTQKKHIVISSSDAGDNVNVNNPPFALNIESAVQPAHGVPAGSRIIVNPEEKIKDFDVVLIYYKKQLALKKILTRDDSSLEFISHDGTAILINNEEIISGELKILGKVTSVIHKPNHGL